VILADVMDDIATALRRIDGLRTYGYSADAIQVPAAVVTWPDEVTYDAAYGRGADRMVLPVLVLVGKVDQRTARDLLAAYLDGTGPRSVKAAIDAHPGVAYDSARVTRAVPDGYLDSKGVGYLGARFDIDIIGQGA
jgi:hypothetical protein